MQSSHESPSGFVLPPGLRDRSLSEVGDTWVEVRRLRTPGETEQYALVLVAAGIDCQIVSHDGSVGLLVAASKVAHAQHELDAYARDNRLSSVPAALPQRSFREAQAAALVYCCVLFFTYGAASRQAFSRDWLLAGEAQAGLIVHGEWWRALTALGLHADFGHLFSNLVAGGLLGIVLAQIVGGGLAWLMILLAGGIGNGLNALLQPPGHIAVGASTAIFGAVGLLAVLMLKHQRSLWRRGLRRWVPLVVGVMLVAFLGIEGERIDVGAHIAGFLAGCLLGACLVVIGEPSTTQRGVAQYAFGAAAFVLFVGAWLIALTGGVPLN